MRTLKILLVRPKNISSIGVLNFVKVEPLELEYLASVCTIENAEYEIYDGTIDKKSFKKKFKKIDFDAVALSCYINSVDIVKDYAAYVKKKNKETKVIAGGVVAEVVPELLYSPHIDIIVHSGGFEPFRRLLKSDFKEGSWKNIRGIAYRDGEWWIKNQEEIFDISYLPLPDRSHFYNNKDRFRYLNYKPLAVMKTSWSCPYECSFCYCKKLNRGNYIFRDVDSIIEEIKTIDCPNIWIVDDIFLLDRQKILHFAERIKDEGIKKSFIVYSRADFIINNRDILPIIKEAGIDMVIVGLEAADDENLRDYNKLTDKNMNKDCIMYLHENNIECTGLFIAGIDYTKKEFKNLRRWISTSSLKTYTVSIFTPLPGTEVYDRYKNKITTKSFRKYDFLHLIINPLHMGRIAFYYEFLVLHLPYIRTFFKENILNRLKNILQKSR